MIVYHYTSKENYDNIMKTREFRPSAPWTAMDSAHGTGWYFTDLDPNTNDIIIALYCWQTMDLNVLKRVKYYLKFNIDSQILKNPRKHVYMIQKWDENLIQFLGGGEKG